MSTDTSSSGFSTTQPFKNLPRPKGVPFLGNILQVDKKRLHLNLENGQILMVRFINFN